jgi:hypothetical protein
MSTAKVSSPTLARSCCSRASNWAARSRGWLRRASVPWLRKSSRHCSISPTVKPWARDTSTAVVLPRRIEGRGSASPPPMDPRSACPFDPHPGEWADCSSPGRRSVPARQHALRGLDHFSKHIPGLVGGKADEGVGEKGLEGKMPVAMNGRCQCQSLFVYGPLHKRKGA